MENQAQENVKVKNSDVKLTLHRRQDSSCSVRKVTATMMKTRTVLFSHFQKKECVEKANKIGTKKLFAFNIFV